MTILEQITADLKSAMKEKNKDKLQAIRSIKTAFTLEMTKTGASEISDADAMKIIQKLSKQRKDSADTYKEGNREDLAEKELVELEFIQVYLPKQLSEEEIEVEVKNIVEETGASSMKEMGKVMGIASKKLAGKADGKLISVIVKKLLS
ncbi:MAG: GatB/YqeY domain-containing protein [Marinifilaceae bacterium]|jgi:uncharacterized protein YqeY|nr:GatB/YqeY domain-containing protein [Marinifilaceae bacterium]